MEALEIINGKNYAIMLNLEEMDYGIQYCEEVFRKLKTTYPECKFIGLPRGLTIQEIDLEEIKNIIRNLNEFKKQLEKDLKKEKEKE